MKIRNDGVRGFIAVAGLACLGGCASAPPTTVAPTATVKAPTVVPVSKSTVPSTQGVIQTFQGLNSLLAFAGSYVRVEGDTIHCQCGTNPKPDVIPKGPKMPGENQAIQNAIDVLSLMLKADAQAKDIQVISDTAVSSVGSH